MDKVCKLMGTVLSFLQRLAEMQVRRAHNASGLGWHLKVAKGGGINCKAVFVFFFFFGGGGVCLFDNPFNSCKGSNGSSKKGN